MILPPSSPQLSIDQTSGNPLADLVVHLQARRRMSCLVPIQLIGQSQENVGESDVAVYNNQLSYKPCYYYSLEHYPLSLDDTCRRPGLESPRSGINSSIEFGFRRFGNKVHDRLRRLDT
jgi:hypothetical protein